MSTAIQGMTLQKQRKDLVLANNQKIFCKIFGFIKKKSVALQHNYVNHKSICHERKQERTSEGRATTVGRAADSRGTLVPLQWHARLTPATVPTEL